MDESLQDNDDWKEWAASDSTEDFEDWLQASKSAPHEEDEEDPNARESMYGTSVYAENQDNDEGDQSEFWQ